MTDTPTTHPEAPPVGEKPRRAQKIALLALVALGLLAAQQLGVLRALSEPEQLRAWIVERGAFGQLAFVVAFALLQPFGVPGTIFVLVAPILWPWPEAFALSMTGTMAASVIGFSFSRFIARDWVAARVPERFKRYEAALERRAFLTVATLRFLLWMPQALHAVFGVSRVPFWTHFWGSLVGYALPLLATAFFGERLFAWFAEIPAAVWGSVGLALVVLVLLGGFVRWCAVNREARATTTSPP